MEDVFKVAADFTAVVPGDGSAKLNPIHGEDIAEIISDVILKYDSLPQGYELTVGGTIISTITI